MMVGTDDGLAQGLVHVSAAYRYSAALAVGTRNKVQFAEEVTDLLADPDPAVQQAARRGLIELSRKQGQRQDFGPTPDCTPLQAMQAAEQWRDWCSKSKMNK